MTIRVFLSTLSLRRATGFHKINCQLMVFLSTLSLRRATVYADGHPRHLDHFYPRSPCGERLELLTERLCNSVISIHALLAESDCCRHGNCTRCCGFLSTLSLRRATDGDDLYTLPLTHFYPRSPCGERRLDVTIIGRTWDISIHALLAESDPLQWLLYTAECSFLSTLSLRRATCKSVLCWAAS